MIINKKNKAVVTIVNEPDNFVDIGNFDTFINSVKNNTIILNEIIEKIKNKKPNTVFLLNLNNILSYNEIIKL